MRSKAAHSLSVYSHSARSPADQPLVPSSPRSLSSWRARSTRPTGPSRGLLLGTASFRAGLVRLQGALVARLAYLRRLGPRSRRRVSCTPAFAGCRLIHRASGAASSRGPPLASCHPLVRRRAAMRWVAAPSSSSAIAAFPSLDTCLVLWPIGPDLVDSLRAVFHSVAYFPIQGPDADPNAPRPTAQDYAAADAIFAFALPAELKHPSQAPRLALFQCCSAGVSHLQETAFYEALGPESQVVWANASGIQACVPLSLSLAATALSTRTRADERRSADQPSASTSSARCVSTRLGPPPSLPRSLSSSPDG